MNNSVYLWVNLEPAKEHLFKTIKKMAYQYQLFMNIDKSYRFFGMNNFFKELLK